jgi:hypothetical protein
MLLPLPLFTPFIALPPHTSTPHIFHTHAHLDLIVWLVSLDPLFDFTIYALQVCMRCLPSCELHISLSCRMREKAQCYSALIQKYHIFWEKREGITSLLPWWGSTNTTYWETWECHTVESLSFILKTYRNSRTMVVQRTWDMVLDLIVLSFNCSRLKWRLRSPMVEGTKGNFESQISLF